LGVGNLLAAQRADASAHPAIHEAAHQRHRRNIVHPRAQNQFRLLGRLRRGNETIDLFRRMLPVRIENDHQIKLSIQEMA
jgi:hypothetical protein